MYSLAARRTRYSIISRRRRRQSGIYADLQRAGSRRSCSRRQPEIDRSARTRRPLCVDIFRPQRPVQRHSESQRGGCCALVSRLQQCVGRGRINSTHSHVLDAATFAARHHRVRERLCKQAAMRQQWRQRSHIEPTRTDRAQNALNRRGQPQQSVSERISCKSRGRSVGGAAGLCRGRPGKCGAATGPGNH